jgi:hypothetical protein
MAITRRRIAVLLSGSTLAAAGIFGGALQAATVTAAGDTAACIAALRADRTASIHISNEWIDQFNASAEGSPLLAYQAAYLKALKESRDDYFKAYQYAFRGQKTTANSWVAKGNSAITRSNTYLAKYNAQITKIDTKSDAIDAEMATFDQQMTATDETCAGL